MSKNKKGLGRGFDALFPEDIFEPEIIQEQGQLLEIDLSKIEIDKNQPRKKFDQEALESLAQSIKKHGVLQPIVLIEKGDKYQIVAGERRYRASKMAGLDKIPAVVRSLNDQNRLELSLIENVQREDLNIIEIAMVYARLRDEFNMTMKQIGESVGGKSITSVSNALKLLTLPKYVIEHLINNELTEGQVRTLTTLPRELIDELVPQIIKHQWSARKVERIVANYKKTDDVKKAQQQETKIQKIFEAEKRSEFMTKKFKTAVKVKAKKRGSGGVIEINFKDQEDFDRITKQLM